MNTKVESLKKRTKADMIICFLVSVLALFKSCESLIGYFSNGMNEVELLLNGIYDIAIFVSCLMIGLIIFDAHKNGSPFTKKVIRGLRFLAIWVLCTGFLPIPLTNIIHEARTGSITIVTLEEYFAGMNVVIMLLGVLIGIISEIFVYGYELQQDNDLIA